MLHPKVRRWSALGAISALSLACGQAATETATAPPPDPGAVYGVRWELVRIRDGQGTSDAIGDSRPSVRFEADGIITGFASINRYRGRARLSSSGGIAWSGPLAGSRMAGPAPLMQQERRFMAALPKTRSLRQVGDKLELLDPTGDIMLEFERAAVQRQASRPR